MVKAYGIVCFIAVAMFVSAKVNAEQRISVSGPIHFVADPAGMVPMDKGHSIVLARWNGIATHQDPSAPWNHTRVDCVGMIDAKPDGVWEASGYCMHTDPDGDQWVGKWRNGSAMNGQYVFEAYKGVSGKYIGATGGGVGTCKDLGEAPRGTTVCVNKGDLVIK